MGLGAMSLGEWLVVVVLTMWVVMLVLLAND